jgi:hypothetical protein
MFITDEHIEAAIDRGYTETPSFINLSEEAMRGHVSNIKGIALEIGLEQEIEGSHIFESTNHKGTDIYLDSGEEYSVKSGSSIYETLEDLDEGLDVIATSEIADQTDAIDAGISNEELTEAVENYLDFLA